MTVTEKIKIPFHLCDPAGILFFGSLYQIYHQFLEDHISEFNVDWADWFKGETACPIRGLKTSYDAPLFFGKTYTANWELVKISQSTASFKFSVKDGDNLCAETEVTHCFVNPKNGLKADMPNKIKSAFEEFL